MWGRRFRRPWLRGNRPSVRLGGFFVPPLLSLLRQNRPSDYPAVNRNPFDLHMIFFRVNKPQKVKSFFYSRSTQAKKTGINPGLFYGTGLRLIQVFPPISGRFPTYFPGERNKTSVYFVAFVRAFYLTGPSCPAQRNKIELIVSFAYQTPIPSFRLCYSKGITNRPRCQLIFRPADERRRRFLAASCISAIA